MKSKEAVQLAKSKFGEHAYAEIPNRGMPTVGVVAGDEHVVFGAGLTFEEAFVKADRLAVARTQASLLYAGLGIARVVNDTCEVGVKMYGSVVVLGRASTFEAAFARANKTAVAKHADEIVDACTAVTKRFGSVGKIVISDLGDIKIYRGAELMGYGASFVQAVARATAKDEQGLRMSRCHTRTPAIRACKALVEHFSVASGPLELNNPA